jgi:threonine dehydrogenase-like Zn-dependent dehydrogenase
VLDLVAQQRLDPGRLVTRTVCFDDAAEAMTSGELKLVFVP